LSTQQLSAKELFIADHEKQWIETHRQKITPAIAAAKEHLVEAGFAPERISSAILTHETSRAAAVVRTARSSGCDTIVMGRRGLTSVGEFRVGRVSRKILQLAFQPALWIVN
jgi:nucleotide-binding universal stress UspA family protein